MSGSCLIAVPLPPSAAPLVGADAGVYARCHQQYEAALSGPVDLGMLVLEGKVDAQLAYAHAGLGLIGLFTVWELEESEELVRTIRTESATPERHLARLAQFRERNKQYCHGGQYHFSSAQLEAARDAQLQHLRQQLKELQQPLAMEESAVYRVLAQMRSHAQETKGILQQQVEVLEGLRGMMKTQQKMAEELRALEQMMRRQDNMIQQIPCMW